MRRMLPPRNGKLFDTWSVAHLVEGVILGVLISPFWALVILILWEPFEVLVLSPFLWRKFEIVFGRESINNSLSDIVFDVLGVIIGAYLLS
jgi:hypothetical protein